MRALPSSRGRVARTVRNRIARGADRVWRSQDFSGLSPTAVAQALSRLSRKGEITRLGKGLYYRSRETLFGASSPNPARLRRLAAERGPPFPSGLAAANLLGFTTQNPAQVELATSRVSLPRVLVRREP